mmetsp:Transcript_14097/g.40431  ORF Transcript_14097/g.40431 Transcript_14097/m.40431 type:complete len:438 (-) Transcript_14097:312-1625(-)|eukprot:CAMPEP_0181033692 /NCGR_PEP_ID=MMETSP1070-20121207/7385_1 /TAXON_ID=265543 /ORGANISM="Minutocellus polymorphus, Strain NH13" /LENGTH=437 /DNA_ID=CAMNT_0023111121 /DNA_START=61 /DNA_END=1374 /DNA_ORIENTATION=+
MFKFGFDLPTEDNGTANDADRRRQEPSAGDGEAPKDVLSRTSKPQLSVLDMSDAITAVFESDTLFEYVPLLLDGNAGDGAGGAGAPAGSTDAADGPLPAAPIQPLRRVIFPPDQKVPPSLAGDATAGSSALNGESLADTDLIPGVYEGGLKVWECSLDLCRHLAEEMLRLDQPNQGEGAADGDGLSKNNDVYHALSRTGKTMELGCGHGLPACLVLRELRKRWDDNEVNNNNNNDDDADDAAAAGRNAEGGEGYSVLFSDYNEFVLQDATVPNVVLNMDSDRPCPNDANEWGKVKGCVACVSGDWMDLSNRLQAGCILPPGDGEAESDEPAVSLPDDGRFDLILAAETTYTPESAKDTAEILGKHLKIDTGVGLVATKRYYFGVGGGADAFRQAAASLVLETGLSGEEVNCELKVETVKSYDSGVGRDLLRVRLEVQ